MVDTHVTITHEEIQQWADSHAAIPTAATGTGELPMVRLSLPGDPANNVEMVSWDSWFDAFDNEGLAFVYDDQSYQLRDRREVAKQLS